MNDRSKEVEVGMNGQVQDIEGTGVIGGLYEEIHLSRAMRP